MTMTTFTAIVVFTCTWLFAVFTPHLSESDSCESYVACRMQNTMGKIVNASRQPNENGVEDAYDLLLKSSTFCVILEDMATCVITETQAGRCSFSNEFANSMKQVKQNIADACNGKVSATRGDL